MDNQRVGSQASNRKGSIEKANGKALDLVNVLAKNIEGQCLSIGMYPVFSRASIDS